MWKRLVLSLAAFSPGVVAISVQEMALSFALMLLGITGFISVAAVTLAVSPRIGETLAQYDTPEMGYPSLLLKSAFGFLDRHGPAIPAIRAQLQGTLQPRTTLPEVLNREDQIALILTKVMERWGERDIAALSDAQAQELWLIERILRASAAEAGALSGYFAAPDKILAMRDQVANSIAV